MKALTAIALTTAMLAIAAQPVLADDDYRVVSKKVLAEYCATVPADSRTVATLMGVDGKQVTGTVHCETDYEFDSNDRGTVSSNDDRDRDDDDRGDD